MRNQRGDLRQMGDAAFRQWSEEQLAQAVGVTGNSVTTIAWHVGGNLRFCFSEFLGTGGEEPWRDREAEFLSRHVWCCEQRIFSLMIKDQEG